MEYKITIKNQIKSIEALIYSTITFLILVIYIYNTNGYDDGIPIIFGTAYLIVFIPTIFLHIEYLFRNRNMVVDIDLAKRVIRFNEDGFSFDEIEKIKLYMPPVWHRKGFIKLLSFEDYRYATIELKSGKCYIITCLMIYDLEEAMSTIIGITIEKKKRLIASPLIEQLIFE